MTGAQRKRRARIRRRIRLTAAMIGFPVVSFAGVLLAGRWVDLDPATVWLISFNSGACFALITHLLGKDTL